MTRCKEFYDKVEKDGEFCKMGAEYRRIRAYMEYCKAHNIEVGSISQGEWRKRVTERRLLDNPKPEPVEDPEHVESEPVEDPEHVESEPAEKTEMAIATPTEQPVQSDESEMDTYIRLKSLLMEVETGIAKLKTKDMKVKIMSELAAIVKRMNSW